MTNTESYCRACDDVFDGYPWTHADSEHPDTDVEVKKIKRTNNNGERITEPDNEMGHYGPHHFVEVDGVLLCPECGALNIDGGER